MFRTAPLTSRSVVVVLALTMLLAACSPATSGGAGDDAESAAALRAFDSCDGLTTELRRRGLAQLVAGGTEAILRGATGDVAVAAEAQGAADAAPAPAGPATAWSGTNVQVQGVDEPDVVKTDGAYVYTVADSALRIIDVRADRPRVTATLPMDGGMPRDLLLHGSRLLVLGDDAMAPGRPHDPLTTEQQGVAPPPMVLPRTRLWSVDVTDAEAPRVESTIVVDGGLLTARLNDGTARVVIRSLPVLPYALGSPGPVADGVRRRIVDATADDLLPRVTVDGGRPAPLVACTAVRAPDGGDDLGLVSVLSLDLDRAGLHADRVNAVLGGADTVYADADSLYVTTSRWPIALPVEPLPLPEPLPAEPEPLPVEPEPLPVEPEPQPAEPEPFRGASEPGPAEPEPLPGASEPVPGASEPLPGASEPSPLPDEDPSTASEPLAPPATEPAESDRAVPPSPTVTTEVHRFDLDADGATYVASGSVPGTVLNQWALSEHDDHLRIATTVDVGTRGGSHSAVHVLRRDGSQLTEVGRTSDLGRGERIYAVRYAGALGFVVTFRQVDPLYTLDLSDPASPSVLGELKIPGYSAYLHPVGSDHLLGVGQDADRDGTVTGLQVSLFDVSDLRSPARVAQIGLGPATSTPAEYDHRALLAWPERELIAMPVERWEDGGSGVLVLTATDDGRLVERGTIDLGATAAGGTVRTVVIGDRLLTVSPDLVTVSDIDTLAMLSAIRL
ncbi:MAG TPA: beta-propeller domain-containing protein [Euzebyales bacterium]|nr:beta-propeller domain-containing protein [Euzebyales bacterium]